MRNLATIHRPATLDEAVNLLRNGSPDTAVLAGGTSLVGAASPAVRAVVDLVGLDLAYVRAEDDGLHVGAMTTLHDLTQNSTARGWAGGQLAHAAHAATSSLLRRQATLGGTLVSGEAPELAVLLIALGAQTAIYRDAASQAPLEALYEGGPSEPFLLTEVFLPARRGLGVASQAVRRTPGDAPVVAVSAALTLDEGRVTYIGLGVGGAVIPAPGAPAHRTPGWPARLVQTEHGLAGQRLTNQLVAAAVAQAPTEIPALTDYLASAEYRAAMVGTLVRRALGEAWRAALDAR